MIMKQFLIVQLRQAGRGSQTSCTTNLLAGEVFFKKISNLYSWKKSKPNVFKITSLAGILRTKSFLNHCCIIMWRKFIVIFFKKKNLGNDILAQQTNYSNLLALLKKFKNPWVKETNSLISEGHFYHICK